VFPAVSTLELGNEGVKNTQNQTMKKTTLIALLAISIQFLGYSQDSPTKKDPTPNTPNSFPAVPNNAAGAPQKEEAQFQEAVKELDATGLPRGERRVGKVLKPTVIGNAEELGKVIKVDEVQKRVMKDVDFGKQQVLLFHWSGSGQDKLAYTVEKGEKGDKVIFAYLPGRTADLTTHLRLLAVPKDATWTMTMNRQIRSRDQTKVPAKDK
jgi:hypothetical protein